MRVQFVDGSLHMKTSNFPANLKPEYYYPLPITHGPYDPELRGVILVEEYRLEWPNSQPVYRFHARYFR